MDNSMIWNGQTIFSIANENPELLKNLNFFIIFKWPQKCHYNIKIKRFEDFSGGGAPRGITFVLILDGFSLDGTTGERNTVF